MKSKGLFDSFKHAIEGIFTAIRSERNMKIHVCCAVLVFIFGIFFKIQPWEWLICIIWITLVLAGEMINTAIEAIVDMTMPEYHKLAKVAKDVAAGAVLTFAIGAAFSAAVIFLPKIAALL